MLWPTPPASEALEPQQKAKVMPMCTAPRGACEAAGTLAQWPGEGVATLGTLIGWTGLLGHLYYSEEELGTSF